MTTHQIKQIRELLLKNNKMKADQLVLMSDEEIKDYLSRNYFTFGMEDLDIHEDDFNYNLDRSKYSAHVWNIGTFILIPKSEFVKLIKQDKINIIIDKTTNNYNICRKFGI